jgi:hypothetical protein
MLRTGAFLSLVALLGGAFAGCLNPAAADTAAMACCAGMDCSGMDGSHDCCRSMPASPQVTTLRPAGPVLPQLVPSAATVVIADARPDGDARHFGCAEENRRAHSPPLDICVLQHSLLI